MTITQAIQHAQRHSWWSEECPGALQYSYYIYSFADHRMYFDPKHLSVTFLTVRDGFTQEKTPSDERLQEYAWLKQQYQDDHRFLDAEHERWGEARDEVIVAGEGIIRDSASWDREMLAQQYARLMSRAIDSVRWGTFIECVDDYNSFILPDHLGDALPNDMPEEERTHIMMTLATPLMVSFMEEFQAEKAKVIFQHRDTIKHASTWVEVQNDSACRYAIEQLCDAYLWMSVNYSGSAALTPESVFLQLKQDEDAQSNEDIERLLSSLDTKIVRQSQEQASIEQRYALPQDLLDDFSIMRTIGAWMDERKESMVKTSWYIATLLERMAAHTGVQKTQLEWYTKEEIISLLRTQKVVDSAIVLERSRNAVFAAEWDGEDETSSLTIFTGTDADTLYALLNAKPTRALKGIVASSGLREAVEGTAQIVRDVTKESFVPGNILVTTMTRPEFVPLIKHASAIITDEGGITCHAAVVSRELGIPCIIGTQHATKVLKSGQQISLDLRTGDITVV